MSDLGFTFVDHSSVGRTGASAAGMSILAEVVQLGRLFVSSDGSEVVFCFRLESRKE